MILYIGNKLSKHGATPTSVETLGELLKNDFDMMIVSDKKNKILRLLDMLYTIVKYRKKIKLVLIDTYSTSNFYYAFLCAWLSKKFGLPYIPILRGGDLLNRIESSPKMSNSIFKNSAINIAPSNYLYQSFKTLNLNVKHIPNSINMDNYIFKKRKTMKPRLLYVRAFSKVYNPQLAIKVMAQLVQEFPDAELCMVGPDKDGTLKDVKKLILEYELEKNITITGKLEKTEWIKLSENYDIFINTTNFDNTPVSLIEAMALGLPVITTNVGGIPYMLEDNVDSLLVNPNDKDSMLVKIKYILTNQQIAFNLTLKGREKAEIYSWKNVKNDWLNILLDAQTKKEKNVN